jgi:hypothetical protein
MDKTTIPWPTIVTAIVAVVGALISVYTLWTTRREKKRQVKVELSVGLLTYYDGPHTSPAMLVISASNPGHRSVILNSPGIILPNKNKVFFKIPQSDVRYPHELREGVNCTTWTDLSELARTLREEGFSGKVKLVGFYTDAIGSTHKSKPLGLDVDEWSKNSS